MIKRIIAVAALSAFVLNCYGQTEPAYTKKYDHFVGVQVNELLKQLINLNSNSTEINNPYLLTYSIFSAESRWGLQAGFGYAYQVVTDKLNPANHESKINDLSYRLGVGRRYMLGNKWEAGCGIDIIGEYHLDKTFTTSSTTFSTSTLVTTTEATTKTVGYGTGLRLSLGFHISERLMLGTEATYYYLNSNEKQNVQVTETITDTQFPSSNEATLTNSNSETGHKDFSITVPVALFLIVKF